LFSIGKLVIVAAAIVGAIAVAHRYFGISIGTAANIGVAAGTMAVAYFTWESLAKTSEVIKGEDRRHQQSYAPALVVASLGGSAGAEWTLALQNRGIGPAKNISIHLDGAWFKVEDGNRIETPLNDEEKTHALSFLATDRQDYGAFVFGRPSQEKQGVTLSIMRLEYQDMFGNSYVTNYPKGTAEFQRFEWTTPDNLKDFPIRNKPAALTKQTKPL
jgi:hypothetical protein